MMRIGFMVIASAALLLCVACKDDRAEETVSNKANQEQGGENEQEGEGPQWPPPGEKAPPPPGVKEAMSLMANAFNSGHADKVRNLFMSRAQFLGVSDCDPKTVVDRVIQGRNNVVNRVKRQKNAVTFERYIEGYLLDIKRGDKPAECRARVDLELYQTKYEWVMNGQKEQGEAHFIQVDGAWFFVKL